MAYAVAYMRSILGSIPFLVKLYALFFVGIFFWLPPHLPPPVYFMLVTLSSVPRDVFATFF